ncbi:MAG: site-specific DNA-methyltransferase [Porticoccaceae bacterium]|nr:MAG: site-specific DNA-methyltransferase [Porticoccaceae bacterium]
MSESYKKLIKTLQTIFEMDKADLDFGIYRIMNQKRDDINKFLEDDLLPQVKQAFDDYSSEGQGDLQQELSTAIEQAKSFGAPDPENAPAVLKIKAKRANAVDATALENDVFSKLHTFFSRYYDQGDFISQRRYKADTYAIPYQGEEVKLYWANHDQYYIKSSEHLRDYAFLANDDKKSVRIKLMEADTEKDNIKAKSGEERRFVLDEECPLSEEDGELLIHFNFIPVGKQKQEKLNEAAVETLLAQVNFDEWLTILKAPAPTEAKPNRTLLERHLNEYTARNTFDYFIHKDLGGFLSRELDFFIKNEVLFLDDIDEAAFSVTEQQLRKIKIIRSIAKKVIRMLAQLEDFQKKMWLKKKFVIEANYCITLDRVPFNEELFEVIFSNEEQLAEWEELFAIDREQLDKDYKDLDEKQFCSLPYVMHLIVDTKYFGSDFRDALLVGVDDIDSQCEGVLINSDNLQAVNFLQKRYINSIDIVYLDPPYNTDYSKILYKNSFEHSSWLSLISNTLASMKHMLSDNYSIGWAIDDYEMVNLTSLLDQAFPNADRSMIVVNHHPQGSGGLLSRTHEYYIILNDDGSLQYKGKPVDDGVEERAFMRSGRGENNWREFRWRSFYALLVDSNNKVVGVEEPVPLGNDYPLDVTEEGYQRIYPINSRGEERVWRSSYVTGSKRAEANELKVTGTNTVYQIIQHVGKRETLFSNWTSSDFNAGTHGTALLDSMGLGGKFDYPKSINTLETGIWAQSFGNKNCTILDYFAGSGTTGHAAININRKYQANHKYILVDQGDYFGGILKPRIQKAIYAEQWSDSKPIIRNGSLNGVSSMIKTITLESYEDALNNLDLASNQTNKDFLKDNQSLNEDYMLGYWLDVETADSSSLLNIEQFEDPFNYKLNIGSGSVGATKPTTVDLVETFNYLIGLTVKTIDVLKGFKLVTGTNPQGETVLVVWRNTKEKDNDALESFLDKQGYNPRDTEFDHIYVNGDHTLEDPQSKVKMTEIEFKRLMFDVSDV